MTNKNSNHKEFEEDWIFEIFHIFQLQSSIFCLVSKKTSYGLAENVGKREQLQYLSMYVKAL